MPYYCATSGFVERNIATRGKIMLVWRRFGLSECLPFLRLRVGLTYAAPLSFAMQFDDETFEAHWLPLRAVHDEVEHGFCYY